MARKILFLLVFIILFSPVFYFSTGIGQQGLSLSKEPLVQADGSLQSSPRAVALHRLVLPQRVQGVLIYPAMLFLIQYSGLAVWLRRALSRRLIEPLSRRSRFAALDHRLTGLTGGRLTLAELLEIIFYLTLITVLLTLIYLPESVYRGFILRHQFGLSTQTLAAWLRDFWLGRGVELATTLITFGGFYVIIKLVPRRWPVWFSLGFGLLYFSFILLYPVVVTPLFYKVTPVTDPALRERIETMASRAGLTIDDIFVVDASSKTTTVNAYFTGFGDYNRIVLWDTLLLNHPPDEQDVVIAHEMGHWYYHHVLWGGLGLVGAVGLGLFVLRWWLKRVWRGLGWRGPDDVAGYPYLLALIALVSLLTLPLVNGISRVTEQQADQFALEISREPAAARRLFIRFASENLSPVEVPVWEKVIFYTHPPLGERLEEIEKY